MAMADDARRTSFGTLVDAEVYDRLRPAYPGAAVDWLLGAPGRPLRVLDLAAGTGKVTRVLAGAGHEVVAVDPSEGMLAALRRSLPATPGGERVTPLAGTAEQVPLPGGSVDAVVVGQAWHWVRPAAAAAEVARVLRPGGVLGLAWNVRDPSGSSWAGELARLLDGVGLGGATGSDEGGAAPELADDAWWPRVPLPGASRERAVFASEQRLAGVEEVVALASTASGVAVDPGRDALLDRVRELAASAVERDGSVVLPLACRCFRHRLP